MKFSCLTRMSNIVWKFSLYLFFYLLDVDSKLTFLPARTLLHFFFPVTLFIFILQIQLIANDVNLYPQRRHATRMYFSFNCIPRRATKLALLWIIMFEIKRYHNKKAAFVQLMRNKNKNTSYNVIVFINNRTNRLENLN